MALDLQSIYILASGGSRAIEQLDTVTNNIANVNTDGFKKMVIKAMSQRLPENGSDSNHLFVFPRFSESLLDKEQGPLRQTQRTLDFAIEGNGYFKLQTKQGVLYTRSGHFFLDSQGYLVDANGNKVLDSTNKAIHLNPKHPFSLAQEGGIYQNGEKVAQLAIEDFEKMKPVGETYCKPSGNAKAVKFKLYQGYLEGSNVNPVKEMASMIEAHRRFDIYTDMIKSIDRINEKTNDIAKA